MNPHNKNIVVCCDGTGQTIRAASKGAADGEGPPASGKSNVLRLFDLLLKDSPHQVCWYDPGIGTIPLFEREARWVRIFKNMRDEWLGWGLMESVGEAYLYLMERYEPGDRIFLFGFSRGAFTVRALAGMIRCVGLLRNENRNLLEYARDVFENMERRLRNGPPNEEAEDKLACEFRRFSRQEEVRIAFIGVWDTVKAYGYLKPKGLPFVRNNEIADVVRHAVSLDERRSPFQVTGWSDRVVREKNIRQDILEVWFSGDHSDVGGGHEDHNLLAKAPFDWMLGEATKQHLLAELERYAKATGWSKDAEVRPDLKPHDLSHSLMATAAWMVPRQELVNTQFPPIREWHWWEETGSREPLKHTFPDKQEGLALEVAGSQTRDEMPFVYVHQSVFERRCAGGYAPPKLEELFHQQQEKKVDVLCALTVAALDSKQVIAEWGELRNAEGLVPQE